MATIIHQSHVSRRDQTGTGRLSSRLFEPNRLIPAVMGFTVYSLFSWIKVNDWFMATVKSFKLFLAAFMAYRFARWDIFVLDYKRFRCFIRLYHY